jgi:hypothetical protein
MKNVIRRIADFYGKQYTEEQISGLADHLDIKNFRNNKSVNYDTMPFAIVPGYQKGFVREGKNG